MKQFSKVILIAVGFGILTLALSLVPSKPAGAVGSAPVTVTNTPLPVQGTVGAAQSGPWNVGVTGSVNATQSGPWSVGINGTPSVNVASLPAVQFSGTVATTQSGAWNVGINNAVANPVPIRDMDNAARRVPFELIFGVFLADGNAIGLGIVDAPFLPPGKGWVIEHLSAVVGMPSGQKASLFVSAGPDASPVFAHVFVLEPQGTFSTGGGTPTLTDRFAASTPFHAFVGNGVGLGASLERLATSSSGEGFAQVWVSGYLIDCGAGSGCPIP